MVCTRSKQVDPNNNVTIGHQSIELDDAQASIGDIIHIETNRVNLLNPSFIIEKIVDGK